MAGNFLEALLRLPGVYHPIVSPDRKWVAWSWLHKDARAEIYVMPTDGSRAPLPLTDTDEDMYVVSWAADSLSVLVECCQDGNERMRLYRLAIDRPGQLVLLTEEHPQYFLRGGDLHANGRQLIIGANFDFAANRPLDVTCVYSHDLKTGCRKLLAAPLRSPEKGRNAPCLNAQGTHVLYFRADASPGCQHVWLVDVKGKQDRQILNFGAGKVNACWMPDGKRVLFVAEAEHYRRLGIYSRVTGRIQWLINDPQRNIELAWAPAGTPLVCVLEAKNAHEHCFLLDVKSKREVHLFPAQDGGTLIPLAPLADGQWLGTYYDALHPGDLVRFALPPAGSPSGWNELPQGARRVKSTSLTKQRWQRVRRKDLLEAEDFFWQSTDGLNIHGFFYRCAKRSPLGTIIMVHGGPRDRAEARFDAKVQYLLSEGFNVFLPNYRGSTGYGLRFQELVKVDGWGGIEQDDIATGIEALVKAGLAKPGKIGITGTSYGGYSSWHAITHFPTKVVAAAAPICGMTDLVVDYETTRPDLRSLSEEMMGGTPQQQPEKYRQRSPVHFVRNIKGKLLIVQGGQDPNVTPENVRAVRKALKDAGIRYQLLEFDDEGHGISKRENEEVLFTSISAFFRKALSQ